MNKPTVAIFCLIALIGGIAYFTIEKHPTQKNETEPSLPKYEIFREDLPESVLESPASPTAAVLLLQYSDIYRQMKSPDWLRLALEVSETYPEEIPVLQAFYETNPQEFNDREEASLILAGAALLQQKFDVYRSLRDMWIAQTHYPEGWTLLEADASIAEGKKEAAIALLQNRSFSGLNDVPRLVKLTLLTSTTDTYQAGKYLRAAQLIDPENPAVRLSEAQFLEKSSQLSEARQEYIALDNAAPGNIASIVRLGDFYRRHGFYEAAISTWSSGLKLAGSELLWNKVLFWNRVTDPGSLQIPTLVTFERIDSFLDYLSSLKPGQFWNESAFDEIPGKETLLTSKQETFWLRLLDALANENETEAELILKENPFKNVSWAPVLEESLMAVLNGRLKKSEDRIRIEPNPLLWELGVSLLTSPPDHPLFDALQDDEEPGESLQPLLQSSEVYSALFLAAGWNEAALRLNRLEIIPAEFPEWLAPGLTRALWKEQDPETAIAFATKQPESDSLEFLIAEMEIAAGDKQKALTRSEALMLRNSPIGIRAAKMTARLQAENDNLNKTVNE